MISAEDYKLHWDIKHKGYAHQAQHKQIPILLIRNSHPSHNFHYGSPEFTILKTVTNWKSDECQHHACALTVHLYSKPSKLSVIQ